MERVVKKRCGCGANFERPQVYFDCYEQYKDEDPRAARFYKNKITYCDECWREKANLVIKAMPAILEALDTLKDK